MPLITPFAAALLAGAASAVTVGDLRCEQRTEPLGIDVTSPRLSWRLLCDERGCRQTGYELRAAATAEALAGGPWLWQSGRVASAHCLGVPYVGPDPASGEIVWWQVRCWDQAGRATPWSDPTHFEMGLLSDDEWQAEWLNDGRATAEGDGQYAEDPAPLFRREFALRRTPLRARLHITGLGYYEASLNGRRIGDRRLDPGWTDYRERVLYSTYDVTEQLEPGFNCLGVQLGNGWYNPLPLRMWGHLNLREHLPVGRPRFIARLVITFVEGPPQVVVSDQSWRVGEGPIRADSIYLGEIYDARREVPGWDRAGFAAAGWRQPGLAAEPIGPLRAQAQPPIRVTATLPAVAVTEPEPGVYVFDLGQNFAGTVTLRTAASAGTVIRLRYGELLYPDGTLNPMTSVAGQIKGARPADADAAGGLGTGRPPAVADQADVYIARGEGVEEYSPRFTFHGFRYVEVRGLPARPGAETIVGHRLGSDVPRVGSFDCSDERLNRIQTMCDWTFLSNIFSVQSDCPHRERFGYGGDLVATAEAFMMNYDMSGFYAKSVHDWAEAALPDGMLTDTAPFVGIQYCGVPWAMAHPWLLAQLHRYYGDRRLIEEQYPVASRWLDRVTARYPDQIVTDGLSDHEGLAPAPAPEMVTPLYAVSADLLAELAGLIGRADDAARYTDLAASIRAAYRARYIDVATGRVGPGTQASQSFGLFAGLVAADGPAMDLLLGDLEARGRHLSTGILGTTFMLDQLSRRGHAELAAEVVRQPDFPGWGHMLANGATTLWEHWAGSDNTFSHNHPMFGSVSQWFCHWLGGIRPADDAVGCDRLVIAPQPVSGLDWVRCRYDSVRGPVACDWRREAGRLELEVTVPPTSVAEVRIPTSDSAAVTESGRRLDQAPGVELIGVQAGAVVCRVGSGRYRFVAPQ